MIGNGVQGISHGRFARGWQPRPAICALKEFPSLKALEEIGGHVLHFYPLTWAPKEPRILLIEHLGVRHVALYNPMETPLKVREGRKKYLAPIRARFPRPRFPRC